MRDEDIYRSRIQDFQKQSDALQKKIFLVSMLRLTLFVVALVAGFLLYPVSRNLFFYALFAAVALFLAMMTWHEKLMKKKGYLERLVLINKDEIRALRGIYTPFDSGAEYLRYQDIHLADLDVFGRQSLFHMINRTVTLSGSRRLALWFRYPNQRPEDIERKQVLVQELASDLDFRQHFRATAMDVKERPGDYVKLLKWLKDKPLYAGHKLFSYLVVLMPVLNIGSSVLWLAGLALWQLPVVLLLATFVFLGAYLKQNNAVHQSLTRYSSVIFKYSDLLKIFENKTFNAQLMNELQEEMSLSGKKAWASIEDLGRILKMFDQRLNMLMGVLLNVYLLWDIRQIIRLEKWRLQNADEMLIWINNLGNVDAYCSLANLAYNRPDWVYPDMSKDVLLSAQELCHPLMKEKDCVANDIHIEKTPYFMIVTGANMAGKSTYLRTVGSNMLLAMMGMPVAARRMLFRPAIIATSLRTSDSLLKNESYFYAELKRLGQIIDLLKTGKTVFVLLDEILKGTNSKDKEAGSLALLRQLESLNAYGIIATHDLNLAKLSNTLSRTFVNFHFDALVENDRLSFDYRLKAGPASSMNATFLMRKMGITI